MRCRIHAARKMGLSDETANALVYQTAAGAAELAISSEEDVSELRRNVTSPGGTTEAAIQVLEQAGMRQIFKLAVTAARKRSADLAKSSGTD